MGGFSMSPVGSPTSQLGATMGQGVTLTPEQQANNYLQYIQTIQNSPIGQQAQQAQQQTIAMNVKLALEKIEIDRKRLEIEQGTLAANIWAKEQQVKLAQQAHELAVQTQQQSNAISQGQLTGTFNGAPTLANLGQQAQYTGLYNGTPTLQSINQQNQFGLQQGQLTGNYQGNPTLQALQNEQQYGLNTAGVTGTFNGAPTLAAQNQAQQYGLQQQNFGLNQAATTGSYNGAPTLAALNQQQQYGLQQGAQSGYDANGNATLAREQAAAGTALNAAQIGASLRGPGDWAQYLQAMNGIAGSPASALVQSTPGGLGAAAAQGPGPMTLAGVLGQAGMMPQQGNMTPYQQQGGQSVLHGPGQGQGQGVPVPGYTTEPMTMWAGGGGSFNEQTGQYNNEAGGSLRSTMPVGGQVASGRSRDGGGMVQTQQVPQQQGYSAYNPMGALGQVATAARPTNAQLGLSDQEAGTLQNWFQNPNQAPSTWYTSKSSDEKSYLQGLNQHFGGSPQTFIERERNSRPRQTSVWSA